MKIIFCHHGLRDKKGSQDDGLQKLGIKDAKIVSKILLEGKKSGADIKAIYTSPFKRCKLTSSILNKNLKVNIFEDERLNEFGAFENETWIDVQKRVRACIKDIVDQYEKNDYVICVTSGVNVCAFISLAYHLKPSDKAPFIGISSCSPLIFDISKENF